MLIQILLSQSLQQLNLFAVIYNAALSAVQFVSIYMTILESTV